MEENQALGALAALSNETRLRMLKLLVSAGNNGLTAGEISRTSDATPSRASFHLTCLSQAGLVTSSKDARQITYKVNFKTVGNLLGYILSDCCQNNPTVLSCCGISDCC